MLADIFYSQYPQSNKMPKNLRQNAREFAHETTDTPFMPDPETPKLVGRPGRGANGESSN